MTEAEDRKPRTDEARSAFSTPVAPTASVDTESSTTSEFAVPEGLARALAQKAPAESETTSEFALPQGLDVAPQPPAEVEGSAFNPPRTYQAKQAPPAFTPPSGVPAIALHRDCPGRTGCAPCCACR